MSAHTSSFLDKNSPQEMCAEIRHVNKKFRIACAQLVQLNNLIEELEARYNRANRDNRRSFRYSLRLRLCTLEGVRNMIYEWASERADELEDMMAKFASKTGVEWTEDLTFDIYTSDVENSGSETDYNDADDTTDSDVRMRSTATSM